MYGFLVKQKASSSGKMQFGGDFMIFVKDFAHKGGGTVQWGCDALVQRGGHKNPRLAVERMGRGPKKLQGVSLRGDALKFYFASTARTVNPPAPWTLHWYLEPL